MLKDFRGFCTITFFSHVTYVLLYSVTLGDNNAQPKTKTNTGLVLVLLVLTMTRQTKSRCQFFRLKWAEFFTAIQMEKEAQQIC